MKFRRGNIPQINSGAAADIAFLLLVFFLITSSFDSKTGIYRKMSDPVADNVIRQRTDILSRNTFVVRIDADNSLHYEDQLVTLPMLRYLVKMFVENPENSPYLAEKEPIDIPEIGVCPVATKHVIKLETDSMASYQTYIAVLGEINGAYNELRNETAQRLFHTDFSRLSDERKEALRTACPIHIFETEISDRL
ncbi:MAG: biopolymer transporter ExbD [Candidatus Symbiothrix sp.]|jgi:biopolymer transport protein ExbD|nr:biopolymer transporter ExbD [Candidatus Symbiothrix sp.]